MDFFSKHVAKYACGCGCSDEDSTAGALDYLTEISKTINELKSKLNSGVQISPDSMDDLADIHDALQDMHAALTSDSEPDSVSSDTVVLKVSADIEETVLPVLHGAVEISHRVLPKVLKPKTTEAQKTEDYQRLADAMRKEQSKSKGPTIDVSAPPVNQNSAGNNQITPPVAPNFNRNVDVRLA
jgi:hypothetical protein